MPAVRKRKFFRKKRSFFRRRPKRITQKNSTSIGIENSFNKKMPVRVRYPCIMKYSETFQLSTGTAGVMGTQQVMTLNCLYDPNVTGTGHQPYGYDQLVTLYKAYKVNAVKVTLLWSHPSTSALMGAYTMYPALGGLSLTGLSVDASTEQPNVSTTVVTSGGGNTTVEQNIYIPLYKIFGVSKDEFKDESYMSNLVTSAAQPTNQCYLAFAVGSFAGDAGATCECQCTIEYYSIWSSRQTQSQS